MKHSRMQLTLTGAKDKNMNNRANPRHSSRKKKTKLSEIKPPSKVVLLESKESSHQCWKNSAISTDNSEDSDIFHDPNHGHFDVESEDDH